jgi:MFS transporter, SP family, sugar:H+ symporter
LYTDSSLRHNSSWNFLLAFFTPFITGAIDFRYGYVFAACNLVGALIIYFFVIEGQGKEEPYCTFHQPMSSPS